MSKPIRQTVTFKATPHKVYQMLMDSRKHAKFTNAPASISRKVGGRITAYDGYITGSNLELDPDKKIVQAWHASDWPADHLSLVTFLFVQVKSGTRLIFTHRGVPDKYYESIKQGWIDYYWAPMKTWLDAKQMAPPAHGKYLLRYS
jgi:activator of HSP90 ATPase